MKYALGIMLRSLMRQADTELEEAKGRFHAMSQDKGGMETLDQGRSLDEAELAMWFARERRVATQRVVEEIESQVLGNAVPERPEPDGTDHRWQSPTVPAGRDRFA